MIPASLSVIVLFISRWCKEWKLVPAFLRKLKALEKQFRTLLCTDIILEQFEDFLQERYGFVKNMDESQLMNYVINVESGESYKDFIEYLPYILFNCSFCRIIAVLPAISVDCGRGFSSLSRIKNNIRDKIKTGHLGCLIRISIMKWMPWHCSRIIQNIWY